MQNLPSKHHDQLNAGRLSCRCLFREKRTHNHPRRRNGNTARDANLRAQWLKDAAALWKHRKVQMVNSRATKNLPSSQCSRSTATTALWPCTSPLLFTKKERIFILNESKRCTQRPYGAQNQSRSSWRWLTKTLLTLPKHRKQWWAGSSQWAWTKNVQSGPLSSWKQQTSAHILDTTSCKFCSTRTGENRSPLDEHDFSSSKAPNEKVMFSDVMPCYSASTLWGGAFERIRTCRDWARKRAQRIVLIPRWRKRIAVVEVLMWIRASTQDIPKHLSVHKVTRTRQGNCSRKGSVRKTRREITLDKHYRDQSRGFRDPLCMLLPKHA